MEGSRIFIRSLSFGTVREEYHPGVGSKSNLQTTLLPLSSIKGKSTNGAANMKRAPDVED